MAMKNRNACPAITTLALLTAAFDRQMEWFSEYPYSRC